MERNGLILSKKLAAGNAEEQAVGNLTRTSRYRHFFDRFAIQRKTSSLQFVLVYHMLENGQESQEPIPVIFFVEFLDYFGRFSTSTLGGYIQLSILPPKF